jgi:hypothetical protein
MMPASALFLTGVLGVTSYSSVSQEFKYDVSFSPLPRRGLEGY